MLSGSTGPSIITYARIVSLTWCNFQDGRSKRQAAGTPQEKTGGQIFGYPRGTYVCGISGVGESVTQNQSACEVQKCLDSRRRADDGYGHRLICAQNSLFCRFFIVLSRPCLDSCIMHFYVTVFRGNVSYASIASLSMFVLVFVLVADVGVHGILNAHQSLAKGFTCADHGSQHRNGHSTNYCSNRTLSEYSR